MKYAIVTGGTKGIGLGVAKMLLRENYHVTLTYATDNEGAMRCKTELATISPHFDIVRCNQACPDEVAAFTQRIKEQHTHIDCLVCNAGTTLRKELTEMSNAEWEQVMQVNVNSSVYIVRDLFDLFIPTHTQHSATSLDSPTHSSIVFIGSLMGIHPHGTSLAYGVTKSAVHALAKNLVKCFEGKSVNINAIAPGFVETEWQRNKPIEIRNNICGKTALRRFASVEEIAHAVLFCLHNPYVNGSVIEVSGGYSYK